MSGSLLNVISDRFVERFKLQMIAIVYAENTHCRGQDLYLFDIFGQLFIDIG